MEPTPTDARPYASLQDWLERTGTQQKELAKRAGIKEPQMSRILSRSRRCSLKVALKLHEITGVPVQNLVAWKGVRRRQMFEQALKRSA